MSWFREIRRELPWRSEPSLYKTVVSEFMLQQTQVSTVLPYFNAWLKRFPDFTALAEAPEEQVVKAWEGLGYYSRARNLHKVAKAIHQMPSPPDSESAWRELPGIGLYTAAAIASIAQNQPVGVVDGNVIRILTRISQDSTEYRDGPTAARLMKPIADQLVDPEEPGLFNEAMMELGATVCRPKAPTCLICPVKSFCKTGPQGLAESFPNLRPKKVSRVTVNRLFFLDRRGHRILLEKIPDDARRLAGQYQLPTLSQAIDGLPFIVKKRGISNEQITERIYQPEAQSLSSLEPSWHWIRIDDLDTIIINGPHRRWIEAWLKKGLDKET